jgi:hypothetical protein
VAERTDDRVAGSNIDVISPPNEVGQTFLGDTQDILATGHVLHVCWYELWSNMPLCGHITGNECRCSRLLLECIDYPEQAQRTFGLTDAQCRSSRSKGMREFAVWAIYGNGFPHGLLREPAQSVVAVRRKEESDTTDFCVYLCRKQAPNQESLLTIGVVATDLHELTRLPVGSKLRRTEGNPM